MGSRDRRGRGGRARAYIGNLEEGGVQKLRALSGFWSC